jgi:poly(A) polymerase
LTEPGAVTVARQAPSLSDVLDAVAGAARRRGVECYLVGGFVRDRLLGREVRKDIDLLVVGDGAVELLSDVAASFSWSRPQQFEHFGTAQVRGDDFVVEVVRARAERYDPESRKPSVRAGTLDEDVWRRDFTVNALCQTLDGTVLDRTGRGLDDLRDRVLRTPLDPAETFGEDPLRMFRAARFVAELGFRLADGVIEAMRDQAHRADILSVERIATELRRLLIGDHPAAGIEVLRVGGLLDVVLPELPAMVGVEQSGYHVHDVYVHTLRALDAAPPDLITRLAVLLHDVGKPPTHAIAADGRHTFHDHPQVGAAMSAAMLMRLRFSNEEVNAVASLVRLHLRPIQYDPATFSDAAVRRLVHAVGPLRQQLLDVARADTRASAYPDLAQIDELSERMESLDRGGAVSGLRAPLDGRAIMAIAGRGPGRWVGRAKAALEEAVLEGELAADDADAAERWLRQHAELLSG